MTFAKSAGGTECSIKFCRSESAWRGSNLSAKVKAVRGKVGPKPSQNSVTKLWDGQTKQLLKPKDALWISGSTESAKPLGTLERNCWRQCWKIPQTRCNCSSVSWIVDIITWTHVSCTQVVTYNLVDSLVAVMSRGLSATMVFASWVSKKPNLAANGSSASSAGAHCWSKLTSKRQLPRAL